MTAIEYLKSLENLPIRQGQKGSKASNSELYRWLKEGSVIINGQKPKPNDAISFPVWQLVFFSKGNKVTML